MLFAQRLIAAKKVEDMRRELEHDLVGSKLNTLGAMDTRLEITRNLQSAQATLEGAQRDLGSLIAERDSDEQKWRADTSQQLTESGRKLDQAKQDLNKAKLRRNLVQLRAEHDAIVLSIAPVSVGSVMQSGDQFITMVPVDAPLEVETIVSGRNAGFVRVGDPVTVKFDTFPYYTYGTAQGVVRMVSPDSFRNPNQDRQHLDRPHTDDELGALYYRTRLSLDEMKLHDLPSGFRLTPGMPVTGDIKVGKRTILQYLVSRVVPATTEGMREP
jgi:HlyD family secretion protein